MIMLDRRLQVLLDESQYKLLATEARRRKVAVAVIVREAIDSALPGGTGRRAGAAARVLAAPEMPVPEPDALRAELDEIRAGAV